MDLAKVSGAERLRLCRIYFYLGFALLPFVWLVNSIWFFKLAFRAPHFEQQAEIKKYVKLSAYFALAWTSVFIGWQILFQVWRGTNPSISDYISFVTPLGRV